MSQSDYLRFKRSARILKDQTDFMPVLKPSEYMIGMDFNLETTITNTKPVYHQLTPPGKRIVFDMERTVGSCPTFALCHGTDARVNRKPLDPTQSTCFPVMKAPGRTVPRYVKKPLTNADLRQQYIIKCKCIHTKCVCTTQCPCP
jgi:hypothetical protein